MAGRSEAELIARSLSRIDSRTSPERRRLEHSLAVLYQRAPETREIVMRAFRPLAVSVARRYHRGEEPLEDLTQVALLGLTKALQRFDPERGSPFVTYALPTMSGEVRRHYRDTGWAVHVTRGDQELAQRIAVLERGSSEVLTAPQIADRLGISVEEVVSGRLVRHAMRAKSLDQPLSDETSAPESRFAPAALDSGYRDAEHRATIDKLTHGLAAREREILVRRFARGETQSEIGDQVGISQMHVSRILRKVLSELTVAVSAQPAAEIVTFAEGNEPLEPTPGLSGR